MQTLFAQCRSAASSSLVRTAAQRLPHFLVLLRAPGLNPCTRLGRLRRLARRRCAVAGAGPYCRRVARSRGWGCALLPSSKPYGSQCCHANHAQAHQVRAGRCGRRCSGCHLSRSLHRSRSLHGQGHACDRADQKKVINNGHTEGAPGGGGAGKQATAVNARAMRWAACTDS